MRQVDEAVLMRKLMLRLALFLGVCYLFSSIDRFNVAFAALTMNRDLGLSATAFGVAVSAFFWTYVLLELPSNLALAKVGARRWFAFIIVAWGVFSSATALVTDHTTFIVARVLVGAAEAGFVPGILFFATKWFPAAYRGRFMGYFAFWGVASTVVGPLLAANLMQLGGTFGLRDWQWLFLLEGLPPIILGILCLWIVADSPAKAAWLAPEERRWLESRMAEEERRQPAGAHGSIGAALSNPHVIVMAIIYFGIGCGTWGVAYWMPLIIQNMGFSNVEVGYIAAVPGLFGCVALILWARHSDRTGERLWHLALPMIAGAAGLFLTALFVNSWLIALPALCLAVAGIVAATTMLWVLPGEYLSGHAAAAGVALITAIGNLSGAVAPQLIGILKDMTGDYRLGMIALGIAILLPVLLIRQLRKQSALSPHIAS